MTASAAEHMRQIRSVRHQDASLRRLLERDDRGEAILDRGLGELCSLTKEDRGRQTEQSTRALARRRLHRRLRLIGLIAGEGIPEHG